LHRLLIQDRHFYNTNCGYRTFMYSFLLEQLFPPNAGKKLSYPELPELYGVVYSLRLNWNWAFVGWAFPLQAFFLMKGPKTQGRAWVTSHQFSLVLAYR